MTHPFDELDEKLVFDSYSDLLVQTKPCYVWLTDKLHNMIWLERCP